MEELYTFVVLTRLGIVSKFCFRKRNKSNLNQLLFSLISSESSVIALKPNILLVLVNLSLVDLSSQATLYSSHKITVLILQQTFRKSFEKDSKANFLRFTKLI